MAYTALIVAILALWVACTALYVLFRDHTALVKSVINSLEEPDGSHIGDVSTPPGDETTLDEELEAITTPDFVEYEREKELIEQGKAVEWS